MHIAEESDVVTARRAGRALAERLGFSRLDLTLITTAISEVGRNIVQYAGSGEIELTELADAGRAGIRVLARDAGPGIPDVRRALEERAASGRGPGLGLPGAQRLMDHFDVVSVVGRGTTVAMTKWLR